MVRIILGFVGVERCGKDTIADYLVEKYGFIKHNMASPIKQIASIMFGWSQELLNGPEKDNCDTTTGIVPRDFMKWFGTKICQYDLYEAFPKLGEHIKPRTLWVNAMKNIIVNNPNSNIIVPDIRFKHEADAIIQAGGILVHISRTDTETAEQLAKYELLELLKNTKFVINNNNGIQELYTYEIPRLLMDIEAMEEV